MFKVALHPLEPHILEGIKMILQSLRYVYWHLHGGSIQGKKALILSLDVKTSEQEGKQTSYPHTVLKCVHGKRFTIYIPLQSL